MWLRDHPAATVVLHRWDKYGGRVLGDLMHPKGGNLSVELLRLGAAQPYDGRRRPDWCSPPI